MVVSIPLVADVPGATQYPPSRPRDRRVAWPPGQINALARTISASEENGPAEQFRTANGVFDGWAADVSMGNGATIAQPSRNHFRLRLDRVVQS
jgi:hypothetical protein